MPRLIITDRDWATLESLDIPKGHVLVVAKKEGRSVIALCNTEFEEAITAITRQLEPTSATDVGLFSNRIQYRLDRVKKTLGHLQEELTDVRLARASAVVGANHAETISIPDAHQRHGDAPGDPTDSRAR